MKGGRAMTKGPLREGKYGSLAPVKIEAFHLQTSIALEDFVRNFITHPNTDLLNMSAGQLNEAIAMGPFAGLFIFRIPENSPKTGGRYVRAQLS